MKEGTRTLRDRTQLVLTNITADVRLEAEWLQMLSLLEFVGARKIAAHIGHRVPETVVLEHWADETRHAAVLRKAAEQLGGAAVPCFCPLGARRYFQALDRRLTAWAVNLLGRSDSLPSYLLVTTIIENRAMFLYPIYRAISSHGFVKEALAGIIKEEQAHRTALEERTLDLLAEAGIPTLDEPSAIEAQLFLRLLGDLDVALGARATPAVGVAG